MKKKELVDLIASISLMLIAVVILLLPTFKVNDLSFILKTIFGFYALIKFTQFILILKEKDFESLFTCLISLGALISLFLIDFTTKNMVLVLMIWMALMCLIKLKKADFYHDRKNRMWVLRLFILFAFLTSGLLTGLNLYYEESVQTIIVGFFFLINGILDIVDPIAVFLMEDNK
mgnify:CR=1 FL=1